MKIANIVLLVLVVMAVSGCKDSVDENDTTLKTENNEHTNEDRSLKKKNESTKQLDGEISIQLDGKTYEMSGLSLAGKQVNYENNRIYFMLNDTDGKSLKVDIAAPDLLSSTPITITEQMQALPPQEAMMAKRKSNIKFQTSGDLRQAQIAFLIEGSATLRSFSTDKLEFEFTGKGWPMDKQKAKTSYVPMSGSVMLKGYKAQDVFSKSDN